MRRTLRQRGLASPWGFGPARAARTLGGLKQSQVVTVGSGSGNIVVQIHGDGNTVDLGRPHD
jgi:hypothetical protein